MTLDQILLILLVAATVGGVSAAWLIHRTQAKWRQKDLLRELLRRWSSEVTVPTELDSMRFDADFRPLVEKDECFGLAFKLVSQRARHQYEEFMEARSAYIESCHGLYEQLEAECAERTGLPAIRYGVEVKDWPSSLLMPFFAQSVYEQVWNTVRSKAVLPEDTTYEIKSWSLSQKSYKREGLYLFGTVKEPYHQIELAQADDRSKLEAAQLVHLDMMKIEHGKKFAEKIAEINRLREKAENLASDVRKNMRRLEVS